MLKKISSFLLLCLLCVSPVVANSAQTYWEGENHTGVIQSGEESPLIVQKEELIFTINEFPSNYYSNVEDAKAYSGKVEAKYTFHNPSDMNIKVRLLFPFGNIPSYGEIYNAEADEVVRDYNDDKYKVTINNKEVKKTIRHTFKPLYDPFVLENDLGKVMDTYKENEFLNVDTPVIKYTFEVEKEGMVYLADSTDIILEEYYRIYGDNVSLNQKNDGTYTIKVDISEEDDTFDIYYFGKGFKEPQFSVYSDYKLTQEASGKVVLKEKEEFTFKEYVENKKPKHVSSLDYFNAYMDSLYTLNGMGLYSELNYEDRELLKWYEYILEVGPNETVVNTVVAPLYPGMNTNYDPTIYEYTYLLTPASTFKEFKDLTIQINTPYFLNTCNLEGFEKKEGGYVLKLDTLPEKDLEFVLSENEVLYEKPKPARDYVYPIYFMLMVFGPFVLLGGLALMLIYFTKSKQ